MSGRPGPWCMAMAYAKSPVDFGHDQSDPSKCYSGSSRMPTQETSIGPLYKWLCIVRYKSAPIRNVVN